MNQKLKRRKLSSKLMDNQENTITGDPRSIIKKFINEPFSVLPPLEYWETKKNFYPQIFSIFKSIFK